MNKNFLKNCHFSYAKSEQDIYCLFRNFPVILIQNVIYYFYLKGKINVKFRFQETNYVFRGTDFQDFTDQNVFFLFLWNKIELITNRCN